MVKDQLASPAINVMNGEPFGTEDASAFDMSSLFRIDTDMLKSAFQFDTSKLNFDLSGAFDLDNGSVDLGSLIDPDDFQLDLDLTEMPDLDMSTLTDLFANMDLSVSEDKMQELAQKVLVGYKDYVIGNGILNLNKISFSQYLKSDAFKTLMNDAWANCSTRTPCRPSSRRPCRRRCPPSWKATRPRSPRRCKLSWAARCRRP